VYAVWIDRGFKGDDTALKWPTRPTIFITTFNQWLGCFRVESRAKIWHHKRQSVPLPLLINRFDFHGLREEEIGSKIDKKTRPPSFLLLAEPFSPLSLSPPRPLATNTFTTSLTTSISITSSRLNTSSSECAAEPLSLSFANFSSSFTSNRHRPPFPPLKPPEPPAEPPCHNQAFPMLGNPLSPPSSPSSSPRSACRTKYYLCMQGVGGKIINPPRYRPDLFHPSPKKIYRRKRKEKEEPRSIGPMTAQPVYLIIIF